MYSSCRYIHPAAAARVLIRDEVYQRGKTRRPVRGAPATSPTFVLWPSHCNNVEGFVVGELTFHLFFKNPCCFAVFRNQRAAKQPTVKGVTAQTQTCCRLLSVVDGCGGCEPVKLCVKPQGCGVTGCQPLAPDLGPAILCDLDGALVRRERAFHLSHHRARGG